MTHDPEPGVPYAVGLDIGDGESSLSWLPTHDRAQEASVYDSGTGGGVAIVTALGHERLSGGAHRYVIGEAAVTAKDVVHFSVNFKTRPDPVDLAAPEAVRFAWILLTEFFSRHPEVRRNCTVYVGHPTGWDSTSVATYARHLSSMDMPVELVAESQSALVHVRDRRARSRQVRGLDRVLVVDIGSSTTDFTFVEELVPRNLPVGSELGCAVIDRALADMVREAFAGDGEFTRALDQEGAEQMLRLLCRRAKEAQFTGTDLRLQQLQAGCDARFTPFLGRSLGWLRGVNVPRDVVRGRGGWAERFADVLTEVRGLLGAAEPELVVITGGGSRMPVVRELCLRAFPEAAVENDTEPSLSVTRGLASIGRHRVTVDRFRYDIQALKGRPEIEQKVRAGLLDAYDRAKNTLEGRLLRGSLGDPGSKDIDARIRQGTGMDQVLADLRARLHAEIAPMALDICRSYGIRDDEFTLDIAPPEVISDAISARIRRLWRTLSAAEAVLNMYERMASHGVYVALDAYDLAKALKKRGVLGLGLGAALALPAGAKAGAAELIRRTLRNARLDPAEVTRAVSDVAEQITTQMDHRAEEVERFVSAPPPP